MSEEADYFDGKTLEQGSATPKEQQEQIRKRLDDSLEYAALEGLVESVSPGVFKFSHDRLQQCFYNVVSERQNVQQLHLRIGRTINHMSKDGNFLFLAVNQMNRGAAFIDAEDERLVLIRLNLTAGEKAKSLAFIPVAQYLQKARQLVKEDDWVKQYELLLELYSLSAETGFACGAHIMVMILVDDILKYARTLKDKIRAYHVRVGSLGMQEKFEEATKEGCHVLKLLGDPMPSNPNILHIIYEFIKTRAMVKRIKGSAFVNLPRMEGWKNRMVMKFLTLVEIYATLAGQDDLMAVVYFKEMRHTLKHGLSEGAGNAFAAYGIILAMTGDYAGGYEFGRRAIYVADRWDDASAIARTYLPVYGFINHFKEPLSNAVDPLLVGYRTGLESGDVDFGCYCLNQYMILYLMMGLPLKPFLEDADKFVHQFAKTGQKSALALALPSRDLARILAGEDCRPKFDFDDNDLVPVKSMIMILRVYLEYLQGFTETARESLRSAANIVNEDIIETCFIMYLYRLVSSLVFLPCTV